MLPISQISSLSFRSAQSPGQSVRVAAPSADGKTKDANERGDSTQLSASKRSDSTQPSGSDSKAKGGVELSDEEKEQVRKLAARDSEVRAHEQAHAAAGGTYAGAPSFTFQRGPDGQNYAIGGEVPIDVSPVSGDPQATITKMLQIKRAALAPSEPSGADRSIAASADSQIVAARRELMTKNASGGDSAEKPGSTGEAGSLAAFGRRSASAAAYSAAGGFGHKSAGVDLHA